MHLFTDLLRNDLSPLVRLIAVSSSSDVHAYLQGDMHAYLRGDMHAYLRGDMHAHLQGDMHAYLWEDMRVYLRGDMRACLRGDMHAYLRGDMHAYLQGDMCAYLRGDMRAYLQGDMHAYLWGDMHAYLRAHRVYIHKKLSYQATRDEIMYTFLDFTWSVRSNCNGETMAEKGLFLLTGRSFRRSSPGVQQSKGHQCNDVGIPGSRTVQPGAL